MYTIKHAAEMVGVNVATLRAWERRYGIGAPQRTESGYRLYDDEALRALTTMNALVSEGMAPKQAAEETRRRLEVTPPSAPAIEPSGAAAATKALLVAAERLDVGAVSRLLDAQYATSSFEAVTDDWLLPAMEALGLAWASGRVTVAGEHMVAHAVVRRLSAAYEAAGVPGAASGPKILIGLPPKNRHEIGVLAFAVAARRAGFATAYMGADLPVDDWLAAAEVRRPAGVVLAVSMTRDLGHFAAVVEAVGAAYPDLPVAVGGKLQDRTPPGVVRLGHRVGPAAQVLRDVIRTESSRTPSV